MYQLYIALLVRGVPQVPPLGMMIASYPPNHSLILVIGHCFDADHFDYEKSMNMTGKY